MEKMKYFMTMKAEERILTSEEVAVLLGVSERSIRDALNSGKLIGYKKFKKWYVFYDDVMKFIKTPEDKPTKKRPQPKKGK